MTHNLSDKLTLLADVTHTKWSNFEELKVVGDNGATVSQVDEKWDDSYHLALGMKYQYNNKWIFRTGIARDETPIDDDYRTSRIPSGDRTWLSFGTSYSPNSNLTIDISYSHLWVKNADINEDIVGLDPTNAPTYVRTGTLTGEYDSDIDILSVQGTWKF